MRMVFLLALCFVPAMLAAKDLEIYFVDVEGGQATLIVTPSGESLLIDTGWPGFNGRDAKRIVEAAKLAKVRRIDDLIITHYHTDHVGGVPQLAERIPIGTFIDHGPSVETGKDADDLAAAYSKAVAKSAHRVVKPGDRIPLQGVEVEVLTANGDSIATPVAGPDPNSSVKDIGAGPDPNSLVKDIGAGAGQPNRFCAAVRRQEDDSSENARSVGILLTFGKFRFIDLGDLSWNKELDLVCPVNRVGSVDVYLTSHHGMSVSGSKALVWALAPRVAIMNNGARKGGDLEAWQVVKDSPGLEGLWQLHTAAAGGEGHNTADSYIANLYEECKGMYLKLSARPDGSFDVTNSRNGFTRTYPAKP